MTAAVVEEFGKPYIIKRISTPPLPEDYDILIRVLAASYCHTDAVFCKGSLSQELPRIGCHEFAGEVVAAGNSSLVKIGTQVGVPGRAYRPCTTCYECRNNDGDPTGYSPYCPKAGNLGLTRDGGFQEFCLVDSRQVAPIPSPLTALEAAPLMCAGLTIWTALKRRDIQHANSIAIMGAGGGLGHLGIQFAAKMGKQVMAVDVGDPACTFLEEIISNLGEDGKNVSIVDAVKHERDTALKQMGIERQKGLEGERGVEAVIILPEAQSALDYGLNLLKNHGTAVVVSFPDGGFTVSAKDLVFRDIRVVGSLVGRNRQLKEMLDFAAKHGIRAKARTFPLQHLNKLVEKYHEGGVGKLIVDMSLNKDYQ